MSNFRWCDFLELAERLCKDRHASLSEARHRTAVSRAYYAAFNICKDRAIIRGWQSRGQAVDHKDLKDWLAKHNNRLLARKLDQLRISRNSADYDYRTPQSIASWEDEAKSCLGMARDVLKAARRI